MFLCNKKKKSVYKGFVDGIFMKIKERGNDLQINYLILYVFFILYFQYVKKVDLSFRIIVYMSYIHFNWIKNVNLKILF